MGTTGRNLTFWLLLSGIVHGLVLGALPPVWTAPRGASPLELRVSLGARPVTGTETPSVPAARTATPSEHPRAVDESISDDPQARSARPATRPGPEGVPRVDTALETAETESAADRDRAKSPAADEEISTAVARTAPRPNVGRSSAVHENARGPRTSDKMERASETARADAIVRATQGRDPSANAKTTEVAALTTTPKASDGERGVPRGAPPEAPAPGEEAETASETPRGEPAAGTTAAKSPTADEAVTEIAALTVPPRAVEEGRRVPPKPRTPVSEKVQAAPDTRERALDTQAAADRGAGEKAGAEHTREADEAAAAGKPAKADSQIAAAPARVSAPAFSQPAGGQQAVDEMLALLHREISRHKRYPLLARRQQREGKATIRFRLHPDGYVDDLSVVRSSGFRPLDDAALRAVGDVAPFEPAARFLAGAERFEVDVVFTLR
ncbi:MAG: TonB family protein [Gammaproteobacteria bacterium]|nr:TonB family protein [Gammaproteobacteria bacterium]NIR82497.1 TonB family protein [Gammaproteobacteria bacterium]NIR88493.1 TonB family protein [Gammaproteobacteria bacterium]NIU03633.1 TonB family protein [Gammaproteobacteria bacterium]NIV50985.1 TonB family protein [Gammaproteobacteria bacterium]